MKIMKINVLDYFLIKIVLIDTLIVLIKMKVKNGEMCWKLKIVCWEIKEIWIKKKKIIMKIMKMKI